MEREDHFRRAKRIDKLFGYVIRLGGMAIIGAVILILLLMVWVALPLFYPPSQEEAIRHKGPRVDLVGVGPYGLRSYGFSLEEGQLYLFLWEAKKWHPMPLRRGKILSIERYGKHEFTLLWQDGVVSWLRLSFSRPQRGAPVQVKLERKDFRLPRPLPQKAFLRLGDEEIRCIALDTSQVEVWTLQDKNWSRTGKLELTEKVGAAALDSEGQKLCLGTEKGELLLLSLHGPPKVTAKVTPFPKKASISALTFVLGDFSIAVGNAEGDFATFFPVGDKGELKLIHPLQPHTAPLREIQNAYPKGLLLSYSQQGKVHLDHMTTERHLLSWDETFRAAAISVEGKWLVAVDDKGNWHLYRLHVPHPDVSLKVLFGKVWYEHYPAPAYVWQSSASEDDFEPKYSFVPLIFGTLKGTLYAMLFSLPLAMFGAIYASQFASSRTRQWIKYIVEMMAAVPSVVVGFLIALWFAPLLERWLVAFFVALLFFPLLLGISFLFLARTYRRGQPFWQGRELSLALPFFCLLFLLSLALGEVLDQYVFGGNVKVWLYHHLGLTYDQRNSIIIAFGLGFAVIPIIFSLVEDALSAVPSSLFAASLALGASRWQTVRRVILPAAIPGIFAAVMIGMGRAIGETMIVLMATGNTPILSLSPFNGMRTLSANIAVELPEAAVGSTLYRILFLSAVLLFCMTFLVNTAAELVRMRLAKKFSPK